MKNLTLNAHLDKVRKIGHETMRKKNPNHWKEMSDKGKEGRAKYWAKYRLDHPKS